MSPAGEASAPLLVMAGQPAEFTLTMLDTEATVPQLALDLAAVTGKTVAPLLKGVTPVLSRRGEASNGIQRFTFTVEIPATDRKQALLLRVRVRSDAQQAWLPLLPVRLEATPSAWKETLRQFTRQLPSGRLDGDEQLEKIFTEAETETLVASAGAASVDPATRIWFAAVPEGELVLPKASAGTVWVIFKPDVGACRVQRLGAGGPLAVIADQRALNASAGNDATAQALLEKALTQVLALTTDSSSP